MGRCQEQYRKRKWIGLWSTKLPYETTLIMSIDVLALKFSILSFSRDLLSSKVLPDSTDR